MKSFSYILPLLLLLTVGAYGQDQSSTESENPVRPRFGFYGGLNLNLHSAGFTALPGVPNCCPEFQSGFGLAPSFGLLYERPISSRLNVLVRVGYSSSSAVLRRDESTTVEQNGEAVPMVIEHSIDAGLSDLGVEPLVGWGFGNHLRLLGGARVGYLTTTDFVQQEQISDQTLQGTFENGQRSRHEFEGDIPASSSIQATVLAGAAWEVPLNSEGTMLAAPELLFSYGLTPISSEVSWAAHAIRAGVSIKYSPKQQIAPPALPPAEPEIPTPPSTPSLLAATVKASGLNTDGTEIPSVRLQVEEFVATESYPLLNYVFFEEGSSTLPNRYVQLQAERTNRFLTTNLQGGGALGVHQEFLNILGSRMRANPNVRVELIGTNANLGVEEGQIALSRARAVAVQSYLRDVWGIAESRMQVSGRNLPSQASNPTTLDGQSENRRVEIVPSDPSLLEAVVIADTARRATPPTIRFRPHIESEAGIAEWNVIAMQDAKELKRIAGRGDVPEYVDWAMDLESETMPRAPGQLFYELWVQDKAGQQFTTPSESITVEQVTIQKKRQDRLADVEIERYRLILFGYNESRLSESHRQMLSEIGKRIKPEAEVIIQGYTDRTGEAERNRELSLERATNVAKALGVSEERVQIGGSNTPLYENEKPEGRFYSRTVTIEVRTPVVDGDSG